MSWIKKLIGLVAWKLNCNLSGDGFKLYQLFKQTEHGLDCIRRHLCVRIGVCVLEWVCVCTCVSTCVCVCTCMYALV